MLQVNIYMYVQRSLCEPGMNRVYKGTLMFNVPFMLIMIVLGQYLQGQPRRLITIVTLILDTTLK